MGCDASSIPQAVLSWPEFPQLLLLGIGVNLLIFGVYVSGLWRIASRRQVTSVLLITTLVLLAGYYIMYGIARPWEHALDQWRLSQAHSASCSSLALQNMLSPRVEASNHLFLVGSLVSLTTFLIWSVASVVWSYRQARNSPRFSRAT